MPSREFVGRSTTELLAQIRRRLGPDALIVGSAPVAPTDGSPKRPLYGITACRREDLAAGASPVRAAGEGSGSGLRRVASRLRALGLSERLSDEILQDTLARLSAETISDEGMVEDALVRAVAARVRIAQPFASGPRRTLRVAFVGPSGSGRTTALLKLAARWAGVVENLRVGVFEASGSSILRLGALKAAFGSEVSVVRTTGDWKALCKRASGGAALLDTAGVTAADPSAIARIKTFLCDGGFDETHLVIPATLDPDEARELDLEMRGAPGLRLLVTKLDEAVSLGRLVPFLLADGRGATYVSVGSNVTSDLVPLDAASVRTLVGASLRNASGRELRRAVKES